MSQYSAQQRSNSSIYFPADEIQPVFRHSITYSVSLPSSFGSLTGIIRNAPSPPDPYMDPALSQTKLYPRVWQIRGHHLPTSGDPLLPQSFRLSTHGHHCRNARSSCLCEQTGSLEYL